MTRATAGSDARPSFPTRWFFELFLDVAAATGRERFLEMTRNTLLRMAAGGIRDQLGGGFHRYSVDEQWLVPHFEKMLYDNAQLASLAVSAWKLSGDKRLLRIADDVLGYLLREMHSPEGGFYATQDADSEGVEGKFFVWTPEEVSAVLETKTAEIFCRVYDVTDVGNFEGANILHRTIDDEQAGRLLDRPPAEITRLLADSRRKLFEVRELRIKPFSDEKILLAWNGLTISALAAAHGATGEPRYLGAAGDAVAFVESALVSRPDGRLLHATKDGRAEVSAFLDDVAAWGLARLDLFETVFEPTDLEAARHIALDMLDAFEDREQGGFYFTAEDHKPLISRTRPVHDAALPSGTSLAVRLCLRLARWTGDERLLGAGERTLRILQQAMAENPFGFPGLLRELGIHLRPGREIIITAPGGAVGAAPLLKPLRGRYAPSDLVLAFDPARPPPVLPEMLEGRRPIDDRPTAYVCRGFSCSAPRHRVGRSRCSAPGTPMSHSRRRAPTLAESARFLAEVRPDAPEPDAQYVRELIATAVGLIDDRTTTADLKLLNASLREMRHAFRVFARYGVRPKVTTFGSARTPEDHPEYLTARLFAERIVEAGFDVITGAGGGIMRACQEGAGPRAELRSEHPLAIRATGQRIHRGRHEAHELPVLLYAEAAVPQGSAGHRVLPRGLRNPGRGLGVAHAHPDRQEHDRAARVHRCSRGARSGPTGRPAWLTTCSRGS